MDNSQLVRMMDEVRTSSRRNMHNVWIFNMKSTFVFDQKIQKRSSILFMLVAKWYLEKGDLPKEVTYLEH